MTRSRIPNVACTALRLVGEGNKKAFPDFPVPVSAAVAFIREYEHLSGWDYSI